MKTRRKEVDEDKNEEASRWMEGKILGVNQGVIVIIVIMSLLSLSPSLPL